MISVTETIRIPESTATVWSYVTDPRRFADFVDGYRAAQSAPATLHAGARIDWRMATGPLRLAAHEEVVHWEPPVEVRYRGTLASVPFQSAMHLEDLGPASSSLSVRISAGTPGWVPPALARGVIRRAVLRSLSAIARNAGAEAGAEAEALDRVRHVYASWGRHSLLYAAQDPLTFLGRQGTIRRAAVSALGLLPGARVLEVACGTGRNLRYLEEAVGPRGTIVAFDYSPDMLDAARRLAARHGWSNITFVQGDAAELDLGGAGDFDGVLSVLGMSAVPDHAAALRRCHEVLRGGARLSVCDARLPVGALGLLNPLIRAVYTRFAAWNPDADLIQDMRRELGGVDVTSFNSGMFFVATARAAAS